MVKVKVMVIFMVMATVMVTVTVAVTVMVTVTVTVLAMVEVTVVLGLDKMSLKFESKRLFEPLTPTCYSGY